MDKMIDEALAEIKRAEIKETAQSAIDMMQKLIDEA